MLHYLPPVADPAIDDIVRLAASSTRLPIAGLALINGDSVHLLARVGFEVQDTIPRTFTVLDLAFGERHLLVVEDMTRDDRLAEHQLVTGPPHLRFLAMAPLMSREDEPVGVLYVADRQPRMINEDQGRILEFLARQSMRILELDRDLREARALAGGVSGADAATGLPLTPAHVSTDLHDSVVGVIISESGGRIRYVNPAFAEMVGDAPANLTLANLFDLSHPDDTEEKERQRGHLLELDTGAEVVQYETRYMHRDGHVVWGLVTSSVVENGDGERFIFTQVQDISKRKLAESALLEMHNRLRALTGVTDNLPEVEQRMLLNVTAVSRRTGLRPATLRAWERRYGIPRPVRDAAGQRLYSSTEIELVERMQAAVAAGARPSEAARSLREEAEPLTPGRVAQVQRAALNAILDGELIRARQLLGWAQQTLGNRGLLHRVITPLMDSVGEGITRGSIGPGLERLVTTTLMSVLHALNLSTPGGDGPRIVVATAGVRRDPIAAEMAALECREAGWTPLVMGSRVELPMVLELAQRFPVAAVALVVDQPDGRAATFDLARAVRRELGPPIRVFLTGRMVTEGAALPVGVEGPRALASMLREGGGSEPS